ncbi:unnamed protein product [Arctia plantaginis]|uniref:Uncharacterized protein n=1 Tax=Arctia plantaginis TaxID=874455 RepID=A0A8S0Z1Z5_ARCPL|nr:unnamed protein product [Arctia plantaginis]
MSVWVGSGAGGDMLAPPAATILSTNTSMESGIEAGVLPTVTGSLASARDSLGSISRAAEPLYDTDHTDLGSELDEAEIRRELMHDVRTFENLLLLSIVYYLTIDNSITGSSSTYKYN